MHTVIVTEQGIQYFVYLKPEYKNGELIAFSTLAFERVNQDCKGQTLLTFKNNQHDTSQ